MSDIEKFLRLYSELGVDLKVKTEEDGAKTITIIAEDSDDDMWHDPYDNGSDKFFGYTGFYTDITFDKDGKFTGQGFFEK
jgi:hypothetical protein